MSETKNSILSLRSVLLGVVLGVSSVALVNCKDVQEGDGHHHKPKPPVNWNVLQKDIGYEDPVSFALAVGTTQSDKPTPVVRRDQMLKGCTIGKDCDQRLEKKLVNVEPNSEITLKSYILDDHNQKSSNIPVLFSEAHADNHVCVFIIGNKLYRFPTPCPVLQ